MRRGHDRGDSVVERNPCHLQGVFDCFGAIVDTGQYVIVEIDQGIAQLSPGQV
jgi:hypothetical protein